MSQRTGTSFRACYQLPYWHAGAYQHIFPPVTNAWLWSHAGFSSGNKITCSYTSQSLPPTFHLNADQSNSQGIPLLSTLDSRSQHYNSWELHLQCVDVILWVSQWVRGKQYLPQCKKSRLHVAKQETPATVPIVYMTVLIGGSLPCFSEVSPLFLCVTFSYPPAGSKNRGCNITCFTHCENPLKTNVWFKAI